MTRKARKKFCKVWQAAFWRTAIRNPELSQRLKTYSLHLLAPYKSAKRRKQPYPRYLTHLRYHIETAFDQLVQRFHVKRVRAPDLWYLTSRWMRKFLSYSLVRLTGP